MSESQPTTILDLYDDGTPATQDDQASLWTKVESVLLKHYYGPDLEAARIVYACVAAHKLPGAPVWPMIVAPPGSMKTELLSALDGLPNVHMIDKMTPNSFISGQFDDGNKPKRKGEPSLLHRIGSSGILAYSDFSTVTSMKSDDRASVLADMRRIYDGRLRKEYGTSDDPKSHEWKGRITFLVAATPDVDGNYSIFQTLGERFVMVRFSRPGGIGAALCAMNQDSARAREELRSAVHLLIRGIPNTNPQISEELQGRIAALAEFAVRGRTHVPRNGYSKKIEYVPEPEAATRLAQQLQQLAKGSALLSGREVVAEADFRLVQRAAFDSIPASRWRVLRALIEGKRPMDAGLPPSTLCYAREDLQAHGLLEGDHLSPLARELLTKAGVL
jgi:hypothetical protein